MNQASMLFFTTRSKLAKKARVALSSFSLEIYHPLTTDLPETTPSYILYSQELMTDLKEEEILASLSLLREHYPNTPILFLIPGPEFISFGVRVIREFNGDFLMEPYSSKSLRSKVQVSLEESSFSAHKDALIDRYKAEGVFGEIVAKSQSMQNLINSILELSETGADVLITGERASGRRVVARTILELEGKGKFPSVVVDLRQINSREPEREFFGDETPLLSLSVRNRFKDFEFVKNGMVILEHLEQADLNFQKFLLDFTENHPGCRILSVASEEIHQLVEEGGFSKVLFERLSESRLSVPPLRERKEDLLGLARMALRDFGDLGDFKEKIELEIMENFKASKWSGNYLEMRAQIQSIVRPSGIQIPE